VALERIANALENLDEEKHAGVTAIFEEETLKRQQKGSAVVTKGNP